MRLGERSRRPGLAHEDLALHVDRSTARRVARLAASDRIPVALWAVIAIESERALRAVAPSAEARAQLILRLDVASVNSTEMLDSDTRLDSYASALRGPPVPESLEWATRLELLVPYHSLRAWQIAAIRSKLPLHDWARGQLLAARPGRATWEAAAAARGQTLGEWIVLGALQNT